METPSDLSGYTDAELVGEYMATDGEPGTAWVEALIAEMTKRDLDF